MWQYSVVLGTTAYCACNCTCLACLTPLQCPSASVQQQLCFEMSHSETFVVLNCSHTRLYYELSLKLLFPASFLSRRFWDLNQGLPSSRRACYTLVPLPQSLKKPQLVYKWASFTFFFLTKVPRVVSLLCICKFVYSDVISERLWQTFRLKC